MTVAEILAKFPSVSALVVGDICLDRWCTYDPELAEPSRETGIPRIGVVHTEVTPGAGGTVANNLVALKVGRVAVLGVIGSDGFGYELRRGLEERGIDHTMLIEEPTIQTFTYTKLLNARTGREDLPRVDFVNVRQLPEHCDREIRERLRRCVQEFDVVIVADQAETNQGGVVSPAVRELLQQLTRQHPGKIFWVDSRVRIAEYRGVIIKPNQQEAAAACERLFGRVDYGLLRRHVGAPWMFVTRGPEGALVVDDTGEHVVPTRPVEHPVDICGAGDSFTAGAAITLALTRDPLLAARVGNLVASVTIMKPGTGTASPEEVLEAERSQQSIGVEE